MNQISSQPEVLFYDTDHGYTQNFNTFCKARELVIEVVESNAQDIKTYFDTNFFPVAVINISNLDSPREQLAEIRSAAHDTQLILISQNDEHELIQELLSAPNPVADAALGSKEEFSLRELYGRCNEFLADWKQSKNTIRVHFDDDIDEILQSFSRSWSGVLRSSARISIDRVKTELKMIISKLFSGAADNEPIASEIAVTTLRGSGKSASYLFKLSPKIQLDGRLRKSAVLKFGPKDEVKIESHNYDKYVEWFLTVQQTVRKIGYEETANFGGLLYSFPLDAEEGYISFADFIRSHSSEVSCRIIEDVFSTDNQHWLSIDGDSFSSEIHNDLQSYYLEYGLRMDKKALKEHFDGLMKELASIGVKKGRELVKEKQDYLSFPTLGIKIANPMKWMWFAYSDQINLSLVHGDLHANNMLVDKDMKCFFIDFYYTGFGHIFRDFIDLELSIRYDVLCSKQLKDDMRLTSTNSKDISDHGLSELVTLEKDILKYHANGKQLDSRSKTHNNIKLRKAYELVTKVRDMAFENFPGKEDQYYLAIAYYSLKAIKYFYPLDVRLYRFIISGMYFDYSGKPEGYSS